MLNVILCTVLYDKLKYLFLFYVYWYFAHMYVCEYVHVW